MELELNLWRFYVHFIIIPVLIALLEDKIHSQEKKIQILEEKCSGLVRGAEKEKEEKSKHLYADSNHTAVNSSWSPEKSSSRCTSLYWLSLRKIILRIRNSKLLIFLNYRSFTDQHKIHQLETGEHNV